MTDIEYVTEIWLQNDDAISVVQGYPDTYIRYSDDPKNKWSEVDLTGFTCVYRRPEPKFKVGDHVYHGDWDVDLEVTYVGRACLVGDVLPGKSADRFHVGKEWCAPMDEFMTADEIVDEMED